MVTLPVTLASRGMELLRGEKLVDAVRRRLQPLADSEGKTLAEYEQEQIDALRSGRRRAESAKTLRWKLFFWRWCRRLAGRSDELEPVDLGSQS